MPSECKRRPRGRAGTWVVLLLSYVIAFLVPGLWREGSGSDSLDVAGVGSQKMVWRNRFGTPLLFQARVPCHYSHLLVLVKYLGLHLQPLLQCSRNHLADLNSPITVIDVLLVSKQIPHFGVQGHCRPVRSPGKNSTFGCREDGMNRKKTALLGAERTK